MWCDLLKHISKMDTIYYPLVVFLIFENLIGLGCFNPCKNHTIVNDSTRLTSITKVSNESALCDNFAPGWYRFGATLKGAMTTECPADSQCGSDMQIWINDTLPTTTDDIVKKQICVKTDSECCGMERQVRIKNCTKYFVYFLVPSPADLCARYCMQDIDECLSSPCQNGATCIDRLNGYNCSCLDGWRGVNCEKDTDECASSPCQNGALCNNQVNAYVCTCTSGWNGTNCEYDIDECLSSQCQNGATCIDGLNGYNCSCLDGWRGVNCEKDIDECASSPCQNGASCNNLLNAYVCTCTGGWKGTNCEYDIDECSSFPCQNGATCIDGINGYNCSCWGGWTGDNCEQDVNECSSIPCQNGATCIDGYNQYSCACLEGWSGVNCDKGAKLDISNQSCTNFTHAKPCKNGSHCEEENGIPTCKQNPKHETKASSKMNVIIAASLGGASVFVIILVTTICCIRARRKMRTRRLELRVDIHLQARY
ncbi:fibropellin-1-like isoform X6 [Mercenaria mercenaria]|uniref:fibropellin-1-like isoform X6 n=1 Tax=Mercenaria mercenaria TaxID=6596 RepID=UPI00234F1614|nr:fibropellin-1-like isoform X6 [Mercenaria mercenaria]